MNPNSASLVMARGALALLGALPVAALAAAAAPSPHAVAGGGLLAATSLHYNDCCYPTSIATADLTGQGHADIITGNGLSYDISVLRRAPLGGYDDPVSIPLDSPAYGYVVVATGDVDGDSHPDLVAAGFVDSDVFVYRGDGAGGFASPVAFDLGSSGAPRGVALADLDGDGHLDIVTANGDTNNVSVLIGDGSGGFGAASNYAVGSGPNAIALGDVSGDGKADIVTANMGSKDVSLLVNDGSGHFAAATSVSVGSGATPFSVALGDVSGDGIDDIATANAGDDGSDFPPPELPGSVSIMIADGAGSVAPAQQFGIGDGDGRAHSIAIADVTGDGNADIEVSKPIANEVAVLAGDGSGGFGRASVYPTGAGPNPLTVADVTDDGEPDILTANAVSASISVLPSDGAGRIGFDGNYGAGEYTHSVATADFNGDGLPDVATANLMSNDVSVLINDGTGAYPGEVRYAVDNSPTWITTGDVDGDGHVDLVVANLGGGDVSVLLGDGSGGFAPASNFGVGGDFESPYAVALGDANNDGIPDIASANTNISNDSVSVMIGDGTGGFAAPELYPMDDIGFFGVQDVILADVTGDGNADLVTANIGSNNLALLAGDGSGAFAEPVAITSGDGPVVVAAGDMDGDGRVDLVTVNQTGQTASVIAGDGAGGFAAPVDWPLYPPEDAADYNPWPWGMTLADIDNDGSLDIVTANTQNDTVTVLPNSGTGIFDAYVYFDTGANPGAVAAADVDGDGDLDVITANRSNNGISVLKNSVGAGAHDFIFADGFDIVPI